MKKLFTLHLSLFILFFSFALISVAQTGVWRWANASGGIMNDVSNSITTDADGNVYTAGYYKSDTMEFSTMVLTNDSAPSADIFISKYNGSGDFLWAKRAGGTGIDIATCIASGSGGSFYLTGAFSSPLIHFENITLTNTSPGSFDIFIAKYDSSGNILWAKNTGGNQDDVANSLVVDENSNLYLTGYFFSDSISFGNNVLTNSGGNSDDIFTAKLDSSGNALWASSAGGTSEDVGSGICVDKYSNVYVTGYFLSYTILFGTTTLTNASMNEDDIFIAKYNSTGVLEWVKREGDTNDDVGNAICADDADNIYLTGVFFSSSISFGTNTLDEIGLGDVYIVKFDSAGNVLWAKSGGGTAYDNPISMTTDIEGNIYMTGYFTSQTFTLGSTTLNNLGAVGDDLFVSKLDSSGQFIWTVTAGGNLDDWGFSIHCGADNNLYVAGGTYSSEINFGTINLSIPHYNTINTDTWLGKLDRTTGIIERDIFNQPLLLYPNPASSQLSFSYRGVIEKTNNQFEIFNALGEKVLSPIPNYSLNGQEVKVSINISDLTPGIYFLRYRGFSGERIGSFIKE